MRVAVIGSGGREHGICWKIRRQNPGAKLWVLPGNAGTAEIAENVAANLSDIPGLSKQLIKLAPDIVIVGPEAPLAAGIADRLTQAGVSCFGPTAAAARIESSKAFAKALMRDANVPTAEFEIFTQYDELANYVDGHSSPDQWVVKADGLAAGKGAFVCNSREETLAAADLMLRKAGLGDAGKAVVLERKLRGEEISCMYWCDGERYSPLPIARDYKRAFDRDCGPNTGGMGSFCPVAGLEANLQARIGREIIEPVLKSLRNSGTPYRGVLYAGLMLTKSGPQVIEFNCRFGDPETQVILPVWTGDFVEHAMACAESKLARFQSTASGAAVCVVLVANGYPEHYERGIPLNKPAGNENALLLHAGTSNADSKCVSTGGRVLNSIGTGANLAEARARAYELAARAVVPGLRYRMDIAANS